MHFVQPILSTFSIQHLRMTNVLWKVVYLDLQIDFLHWLILTRLVELQYGVAVSREVDFSTKDPKQTKIYFNILGYAILIQATTKTRY